MGGSLPRESCDLYLLTSGQCQPKQTKHKNNFFFGSDQRNTAEGGLESAAGDAT